MTKEIRNPSRITILLVASILLMTASLIGQGQAPSADPAAAQAAVMAGEPYSPPAPAQPTSAPAPAAKKSGVMRIGVVSPTVQFGQVATPADASQSMYGLFAKYLTGPNLEVMP